MLGREGVVMERKKQLIKPLVYCVVVFVTLRIAIANEVLARFGLDNNYILIFFGGICCGSSSPGNCLCNSFGAVSVPASVQLEASTA